MKLYTGLPAVIVFVLVILLYFELKSNDIPTTRPIDAFTQFSTQLNQQNAHELPPEDSIYTIIGYVQGLKGYIVQYGPNLYRGGDIIDERGFNLLKNHGVKTIISVTPQQQAHDLSKQYGFQYIAFPYEYGTLSNDKLIHFLDIIKNYAKPLYIHCHGGNRRAGVLCAIYRMYYEKWSFEQAYIEYGKLGGKVKEDFNMLNAAYSFISSKYTQNEPLVSVELK